MQVRHLRSERLKSAAYWRPALAFHGLTLLLGFALLTPAATWLGNRIVRASGAPMISNYDIASFALSAPGIAFFCIAGALALTLLLAELAGLTWIAGHVQQGRRVSAASAAALVLRRLPALLTLAATMLARLAALAVPLVAVAALLALTTLREHDINYYLAEQPPEWRRALIAGAVLASAYGLLVVVCLLRWSFAVPMVVFEVRDARPALGESARRARGHLRRVAAPLLLWWLGLSLAALVAGWMGRLLADASFNLAGAHLGRVLLVTAVCLAATVLGGFVLGGAQLAGHQFLVSRAYLRASDAAHLQPSFASGDDDVIARRRARPALWALLLLVVGSGAAAALTAVHFDPDAIVEITAHRGASAYAPENSLAAFRLAMEQGATYAELDLQRARDGTLVVLHDADFMRMAGSPQRVRSLTAAEIATIDIGRKRGAEFAGERAPTLAEVIALVRGRMKLNIELKYNGPDPELASAVIESLRRERFMDQVVISSLNAGALKEVRRLEPSLRIGLIVTASVGQIVRADVDFLSLNAARATPAVLRRARAAGKQVHVWTVNRPDAMLAMIERGVDNIITDDPALLARILADRNALDGAELLALRLRVLFDKPPAEIVDPGAVPAL